MFPIVLGFQSRYSLSVTVASAISNCKHYSVPHTPLHMFVESHLYLLPRWFSDSGDGEIDETKVVYLLNLVVFCVDQLLVQVNGEVRC